MKNRREIAETVDTEEEIAVILRYLIEAFQARRSHGQRWRSGFLREGFFHGTPPDANDFILRRVAELPAAR